MSKTKEAPLVLVTGVSGFVASWVAHAALKVGYRVRGTVRSLSNEQKVKHLKELCPGAKHELELVEADLTETGEEGWDAAVRGCDFILHVASPFPIEEPKDENELIKPAVEGTLNVLKAAARMEKPPKRVMLTSSVVAVYTGTDPRGKVYSDDDWTVTDSTQYPCPAYNKSKTLAEKAAWEFVESLPEGKKIELATINPSLVQGPLLSGSSCSSADIVKNLATGKMPGLVEMYVGTVSVLDVARAHLLAMTNKDAAGKRFIVTNSNISFFEMSDILSAELGQYGYKVTKNRVPLWLLWVLGFFGNKMAKSVWPMVGLEQKMDPKNARSILKLPLEDDPAALVKQMLYSAIHAGIIPDLSPDQKLTKEYVRPEMDVSMIPPP